MVSMRSEKPICAPPCLSEATSTLPLKRNRFSTYMQCFFSLDLVHTCSVSFSLFISSHNFALYSAFFVFVVFCLFFSRLRAEGFGM